jgi:ABC-type bacteriocin/lantibiotic exporter with double-glycine peptidase domain
VLDEATSAVDPETEAAVHEALCDLMRNRTTIIIAHHSTAFIEYINRAFILENGRLRQVPVATIETASRPAAQVLAEGPKVSSL